MQRSLDLIDQILVIAKAQDEELKEFYRREHKYAKTLGESSLVFHLKALKELIQEEQIKPVRYEHAIFQQEIVATGTCPKCKEIRFTTPCFQCGEHVNLL